MDSIIFDLDGTLWDSTDGATIAWNNVLKNYKEVRIEITKQDLMGIMGLQVKEAGQILFPYLEERQLQSILKECCDVECQFLAQHGGILYDNLEAVLQVLARKNKLFIVSNCQAGYIEAFYEFHKLDKYFIDYENPGRTGLSKGENIKLIISRNDLKAPIYVGDTEGDKNAARIAGIPFVYARYGFGEVSESNYIIDNLDGLLELF